MNAVPIGSLRFSQKLHPLSLLAQLTSRRASGGLQVCHGSVEWSIFLEDGKLTYASNSVDPFERLDRHLRRLSQQIPTLISATRVQVRLLFETALESQSLPYPDYQAICWLVNQDYITPQQAGVLVEELAKEVLESFLALREGSYEFNPATPLDELPKFCRLDMRSLVEYCQMQLRQARSGQSSAPDNRVAPTPSPQVAYRPQPSAPAVSSEIGVSTNFNQVADTFDSPSNPVVNSANPGMKTMYTVACIDDSMTVLNSIKSFLDDKTFSVLMINDPLKALMQVVRNKPDLILLDVEMPNLDGYELCSLLRRHTSFKNTPIIMVTGKTGFIDRAKAKLVRASGYLTKPFTQSDLLKIVFKHLT
ncbi:MAG: response regulator [Nostocaceae cyanobacterium]|nr:response regulator [Nostocaceae cyanobacterium]